MQRLMAVVLLLVSLSGVSALAQNEANGARSPKGKAGKAEMTTEKRRTMANMHQKMADCLNSNEPMSKCRAQMAESNGGMMGKDGCPMMSDTDGSNS